MQLAGKTALITGRPAALVSLRLNFLSKKALELS